QWFLTSMYQKLPHCHTRYQRANLHDFFLKQIVGFLVLYKNSLYENRILMYINYVNQFHFVLAKHYETVANVDNYLLFPYDYLIDYDSLVLAQIVFPPLSKAFMR